MKFFAFFDSKRPTPAPSRVPLNKREEALAHVYRQYGPRVGRVLARNIREHASKEDHTCRVEYV